MKHNKKYTKEILEQAVKNNVSVAGVLRELNIKPSGGIHSYITKLIKKYEINIDHMLGQASNQGIRSSSTAKNPKEILVKMKGTSPREDTERLFRSMIKIGKKYKCVECGMAGMWNNKPIRLHIEHINGDWSDNRPSNLEFLCPNCHSQTQTYCRSKTATKEKENVLEKIKYIRTKNRHVRVNVKSRKKNKNIKSEKKNKNYTRTIGDKKDNCVKCDKQLTYKQSKYCSQECFKMKIRKVTNRPDAIQLKTDINSMPMTHVGIKYGVSDSAIRKWARQYKIL